MLDGIFIGAVATAEMRNAMILMLVTTVAVGELLIPAFGNTGAPQFLRPVLAAVRLAELKEMPRRARAVADVYVSDGGACARPRLLLPGACAPLRPRLRAASPWTACAAHEGLAKEAAAGCRSRPQAWYSFER